MNTCMGLNNKISKAGVYDLFDFCLKSCWCFTYNWTAGGSSGDKNPQFLCIYSRKIKTEGLKIAICSEVYRAEIQILHLNTARMWIFIAKNRNFEFIQPLTDVESVITSTCYIIFWIVAWQPNLIFSLTLKNTSFCIKISKMQSSLKYSKVIMLPWVIMSY